MRCYCSICRKVDGGGGYTINLHADATSLKVRGEEHLTVYSACTDFPKRKTRSRSERRFCSHCGTMLWVWDPSWPELIHPFASAVDTPLPVPPERVHMMPDFKANWVSVPEGQQERQFDRYPDEALIDWHTRHGLLME